jgi:hypothetical protein
MWCQATQPIHACSIIGRTNIFDHIEKENPKGIFVTLRAMISTFSGSL